MKLRFLALSLFGLLTSACGEMASDQLNDYVPQSAILGGSEVKKADPVSQYTVLLFDMSTRSYCTGTVIHPQVILTAAHCLKSAPNYMSVAFGLNPLSGAYEVRYGNKIEIHPDYQRQNTSQRKDMALLSFSGSLPKGYRPVLVADQKFPLAAGMKFTAAGYGRTSGLDPSTVEDIQGTGRLRSVDVSILSIESEKTQFHVNQENGQGICSGDSGGPALMRLAKKDYIVGIASAIAWSTPDDANGNNPATPPKVDRCKDKSIYVDIRSDSAWIQSTLKALTNQVTNLIGNGLGIIK